METGKLYMITAPSGAGKTSLVKTLVNQNNNLCVSISHTTRPPRNNELDGVNYHFINNSEFMEMLSQGQFLESANVYGHYYGTSRTWVDEQLKSGNNVILEIDWQGARQVRDLLSNVCSIYILPPSLEALTKRLKDRGQDDDDTIENRMNEAQSVIAHVTEADFVVVNDEFELAIKNINAIINSQGLNTKPQELDLKNLIERLTQK
ncbi:MAG: guanylate kinase [Gammaproteobacteria bacterium]|nr:guanylate kinase [Gammaproteobacteria bacterium]